MDKFSEFINRYRVQNIRVHRDRRDIDYYNMNKASYYADHEAMLEMEIPRKHFDFLVETECEYHKLWKERRDEKYIREEHPAIKEAYEKYRMLLELYK